MTHLVLGLDPGFATFGYAVLAVTPLHDFAFRAPPKVHVAGLGVLTTKKEQDVGKTVDNIRRGLELAGCIENLFAGRHPHASRGSGMKALFPDAEVSVVCAEAMSFPRNASAAGQVNLTWGIILANTSRRRMPLRQLGPQTVKMSVVGTIDASKTHVERVLVKRWGPHICNHLVGVKRKLHEHAYDALAVATACLDAEP